MFVSCIVVDDDIINIHTLEYLIESECSHLNVIGSAQNITDARKLLEIEKPDVLFLDVEMPGGTGFDLIQSLDEIPFKVVFTTAHEHYALRALKANAVDFLLKPIDEEELVATEQKLVQLISSESKSTDYKKNIERFSKEEISENKVSRLVLSDAQGYKIVQTEDIESIAAEGNYSKIYFDDKTSYLSGKSLRELEDILTETDFVRVHKSNIINVNKLKEIKTGDNNLAILNTGMTIRISRRRVSDLVKHISA